jgi:outer membrane protein OmpA-like peptidoglycan-associated protein
MHASTLYTASGACLVLGLADAAVFVTVTLVAGSPSPDALAERLRAPQPAPVLDVMQLRDTAVAPADLSRRPPVPDVIPPGDTAVAPSALPRGAPVPEVMPPEDTPVTPGDLSRRAPVPEVMPPEDTPVAPGDRSRRAPEPDLSDDGSPPLRQDPDRSAAPVLVASAARADEPVLRVFFAAETTTPGPDDLSRLAALVESVGGARVLVVGHADASGQPAAHEYFSRQRARVVARALVAAGLPRDRVRTEARGAEFPLSAGSSRQALARNRRVEVFIEGGAR